MEEWFHVKHDRMVELQEIAFRVRCLSPIGCWGLVFHVKREGCWNWGNLFGCVCGILRLRCVWQLERSIDVSRETLIVGIVGKGEVCFLNGYFQLSLRDFVIAIVSRETWWVGGWVIRDGFECASPPLPVVVRIDVSRETIPVTRQKFIEHRETTFGFPTWHTHACFLPIKNSLSINIIIPTNSFE